jgi:hypothetical protein
MNFEKFVQRHTKTLFLFIAVMMILPLVLWGYLDQGAQKDPRELEPAGTLSEWGVTVTKGELNQLKERALADWWWKQYTGPNRHMMRFRRPDPPKQDELDKLAWENAVLLADAKLKGVTVTTKEVDAKLRDFYFSMAQSQDAKGADQILAGLVRQYFQTDLRTFEGWFTDNAVITKLLETVCEAEFEDYEKVYEKLGREQVLTRVAYAAVDPAVHARALRPVGAEEVARRWEREKDRYKVPARASVTYLLADLDAFKKGVADPTEAELKAWYDSHRAEFMKPHSHPEGEEHKPDEKIEYRSFEEVRAELPDRIKSQKAQEQARALMAEVQTALGDLYDAKEKKYPGDAFDKLRDKFKDRAALKFDVSPAFEARSLDALEAAVGANSGLGGWAFDPAVKPGEISKLLTTSKGVGLFRLLERKEPFSPGLTERVRERIEADLRKDLVKITTQKAASDVVQEIASRGLTAARSKWPLQWSETRYFKGRDGDTGIEDRALSTAVAGQAASGALKPGQATVLPGTSVGGKSDWAYVIYLEDVVPAKGADSEAQFPQVRRSLDEERRAEFRLRYPGLMVEAAKVVKAGT